MLMLENIIYITVYEQTGLKVPMDPGIAFDPFNVCIKLIGILAKPT